MWHRTIKPVPAPLPWPGRLPATRTISQGANWALCSAEVPMQHFDLAPEGEDLEVFVAIAHG
jgi:hypothetical protein